MLTLSPSCARVLERLDLVKVRGAMKAAVTLPSFEYDLLVEGKLLPAANQWLLDDIATASTLLLEWPVDHVVKMVLDIVHVSHNGRVVIRDWKTTTDLKRPHYLDELKEDFQSSLYLYYGGQALQAKGLQQPAYIEYRIIDDHGRLETATKLWDETKTPFDAEQQVEMVDLLYRSLADEYVWARQRPRACFAGGRDADPCLYFEDCCNMTMPRDRMPYELLYELTPRSKSSMKSFLECPEKFRRTKILGDGHFSSRPAMLGNVFHAGAAELWGQAFAMRKELGL